MHTGWRLSGAKLIWTEGHSSLMVGVCNACNACNACNSASCQCCICMRVNRVKKPTRLSGSKIKTFKGQRQTIITTKSHISSYIDLSMKTSIFFPTTIIVSIYSLMHCGRCSFRPESFFYTRFHPCEPPSSTWPSRPSKTTVYHFNRISCRRGPIYEAVWVVGASAGRGAEERRAGTCLPGQGA